MTCSHCKMSPCDWISRALGVEEPAMCQFLVPGAEPQSLTVSAGTVVVPRLGLWGLLTF